MKTTYIIMYDCCCLHCLYTAGGEKSHWVHLQHEEVDYDELLNLEQSKRQSLAPHNIHVGFVPRKT